MTITPEFEDDPIHQLLSATAAERPGLRSEILQRTQSVLRRRRMLRRAGYALALAGCYVAGILTMSLATPAPAVVQRDRPAPSHTEPVVPAPAPEKVARASERPAGANKRPAVATVRQTRFEKLRKAADRALLEQGDMMAAVKLYKKALDVAKPEELAISAERDNWLLISLKEARLQERQNAKQG